MFGAAYNPEEEKETIKKEEQILRELTNGERFKPLSPSYVAHHEILNETTIGIISKNISN
jgi:hypothetical protein